VSRPQRAYRQVVLSLSVVLLLAAGAAAQEDKKTDDDKPADPDTGESTVEEKTLGLLPNPLQKYGVKFAATYIGEVLGNASGGLKQGAIYEGRLNLAVDVDLQTLVGAGARRGLPDVGESKLASAKFRRFVDGRLPVPDQGRLDCPTQFPVHCSSRGRGRVTRRAAGGQVSQKRIRVRPP
jgi:hypothetical protein